MTQVIAKPGESIDSLIRRFKKVVEKSGVISEYKKRQAYEKPSVKKKRKQASAKKRALKKEKKLERYRDRHHNSKNFRFNKDKTEKIPVVPRNNNNINRNNRSNNHKSNQNNKKK